MSEPAYGIAAFYKFRRLADPAAIRPVLLEELRKLKVKGSVLLAPEGVNGTISAVPGNLSRALAAIRTCCGLNELESTLSYHDHRPFLRLKVKIKKEIVTIGDVPADPNARVGEYVEPKDWNALISDPDVIVIDTRNSYEFGVGSFRNAIDPGTESFSQFPNWVRQNLRNLKGKKIATFCTGGIRCEKATSFMLSEGLEKVYHLKGGILRYLEEIPSERSMWTGACFVFDDRVAVRHGLKTADFSMCHGCHMPVSAEDRLSPLYEEGVSCPACADTLTEEQRASNRERQRQFKLAEARGRLHLGPREG